MAKILIVDDEPDIVRLVARYAEREGYEVTGVGDGSAAIEACRREDFDVIVMDIMMPDTDAKRTARPLCCVPEASKLILWDTRCVWTANRLS